MKSYSCYFIKSNDSEALRAKLGPTDSRSLQPVEGSEWIPWRFHRDDEAPDDEILNGEGSIADQQSSRLGEEVIFLFADRSSDAFVYEHARDGQLIRKLVWFPMLDDDWTAGWTHASGESEPWEATLFEPNRLSDVLDTERSAFEERGALDEFTAQELKIRRMWIEKRIETGNTFPRADATVATLVEEHFGLVLPRRGK